jgi:hypothetical protein
MIINLTNHDVVIYDPTTADVIDPATATLRRIFPASGTVARIVERPDTPRERYGAQELTQAGLPGVVDVDYGNIQGLWGIIDGTWYIVSLATALAAQRRYDLLVPYRQVRDALGKVVGCRGLARPC